jgi:hypothetical protein
MSKPSSRYLYRTALWSVICAVLVAGAAAQIAKRGPKSLGPRALGLVEVLPNGKARIAAICIMIDGKFYDAGTYKATPVPMSLVAETVYEGSRDGISTGLYTVNDARKTRSGWFGEGKWVPTGSEPRRTPVTSTKRVDEEDAPPVLRRADSAASASTKPADAKPVETKPVDTKSADAKPVETKPAETTPKGKDPVTTKSDTKPVDAKVEAPVRSVEDRPILRRSKPGDVPQKFDDKDFSATVPIKERFLAVSDAGGPDMRPYVLAAKPDEVLAYRKKLEAMAAETVRTLYGMKPEPKAAGKHPSKAVGSSIPFKDAQMQTFDLTNSNDPVLVFTATVDPAAKIMGTAAKATVTVIARVDIYGELRKLLAEATDDHHLDVYPRLEFVDAVDADGDGAGELVFREASEAGQGFVIYRAGLDKVWPVFDSLRNY